MNLASLLIANLISLSNLTHFLDRLITDGNYKTVLLIYDDASVRDTNFIPELVDLAFGKYAMVIMNSERTNESYVEYNCVYDLGAIEQQRSGIIQIIMVHYGKRAVEKSLRRNNFLNNLQDVVYLIPVQPDDEKDKIWNLFNIREVSIRYRNCSVIFYQTEQSGEPIEIFALNYQAEKFTRNGDSLGTSQIDMENSVVKIEVGQANDERNLHDDIFGSIIKKPILLIKTVSTANKSVVKTSAQQGTATLVNLGNADYYLSNFIARNLRARDVSIHQALAYQRVSYKFTWPQVFNCCASNEKNYAELYNFRPEVYHSIQRFVPLDFGSKHSKKQHLIFIATGQPQ